jgi:hypothetical protein
LLLWDRPRPGFIFKTSLELDLFRIPDRPGFIFQFRPLEVEVDSLFRAQDSTRPAIR